MRTLKLGFLCLTGQTLVDHQKTAAFLCQRFNTIFNTIILLLLSFAKLLGEETTHFILMILKWPFNAQLDLARGSVHRWALAVTCLRVDS